MDHTYVELVQNGSKHETPFSKNWSEETTQRQQDGVVQIVRYECQDRAIRKLPSPIIGISSTVE